MLSEYISVDVFLRYAVVLRKSAAETGRIQGGSGTKNLIFRQSGKLCKCISHDITWITYDNIKRFGSHLYNLRSNTLHNVDVGLGQLDASLSRFSGNTGSDDHNVRIGSIRIISCHDGDRLTETGSLLNIHNLAFSLLFVDIDQNNL